MKSHIALAAMLGTALGAFALPSIGGPVHFRVTRPFSMFAISVNDVATLGAAPLEFIITDVVVSSSGGRGGIAPTLKVNGVAVLQLPYDTSYGYNNNTAWSGKLSISSGIHVPAGAIVTMSADGFDNEAGVHVSGYVQ